MYRNQMRQLMISIVNMINVHINNKTIKLNNDKKQQQYAPILSSYPKQTSARADPTEARST